MPGTTIPGSEDGDTNPGRSEEMAGGADAKAPGGSPPEEAKE